MATRRAIEIRGVVQGVGFRPFVFRAARARGLSGWVRNENGSVVIEAQGEDGALEDFIASLRQEGPPAALVESVEVAEIPGQPDSPFEIHHSQDGNQTRPALPADLATCSECLQEIRTSTERRYRYPFTNCTWCGPRYTIVERMPYDRPHTCMKTFALCTDCQKEYDDPENRRFHAQPIACPRCGPHLKLQTRAAKQAYGEQALVEGARRVLEGRIVALRGLGGFQLLTDATNEAAVARLRERKHRPAKPFAIMFPDPESVRQYCSLSTAELRVLESSAAPIVLLRKLDFTRPAIAASSSARANSRTSRARSAELAPSVAPGNPWIGAMLPYTPLHHLLLEQIERPVVCTSGNLSEEPMCIDDEEALVRLGNIADVYLTHNRPIVRPMDDSVVRVEDEDLRILRRARGYAPRALSVQDSGPVTLALGGHMKNTVALRIDSQVVLSQHLGDLGSAEGMFVHERAVHDLVEFYGVQPQLLACDLHPDYGSTRHAEELSARWKAALIRVQHHHAHVVSCMAENKLEEPVLGLAWDGTGWGSDGTIWGGEALVCSAVGFKRVSHLRRFPLPGGERAILEPRRAALGLLFALQHRDLERRALAWFDPLELKSQLALMQRFVNSPVTSSMGRLFDAVAALIGLRAFNQFEAQAAMELEFAMGDVEATAYPFPLLQRQPSVADWGPLVEAILADLDRDVPTALISARFHQALVELGVQMAANSGMRQVVLTGGCFQNASLHHRLRVRLREEGYEVHAHREIPANDGGLAVGQAFIAGAVHEMET